jgi:hypothetical protein
VNEKAKAEIAKIEETQRALRGSIEQTKRLAQDAEQLLGRHKKSETDRSGDGGGLESGSAFDRP